MIVVVLLLLEYGVVVGNGLLEMEEESMFVEFTFVMRLGGCWSFFGHDGFADGGLEGVHQEKKAAWVHF